VPVSEFGGTRTKEHRIGLSRACLRCLELMQTMAQKCVKLSLYNAVIWMAADSLSLLVFHVVACVACMVA